MFTGIRGAVEGLYTGRMTIFIYQAKKDLTTGLTQREEVELMRDIPCRLSYHSNYIMPAMQSAAATELSQKIRVFYAPEIEIPPGSKLVIRQNGAEQAYCASGVVRKYSGHAEVDLNYWERWA